MQKDKEELEVGAKTLTEELVKANKALEEEQANPPWSKLSAKSIKAVAEANGCDVTKDKTRDKQEAWLIKNGG